MSNVNLGEKYNHRITLRLSDSQYEFLLKVSEVMDVSPSDYLRMVISTASYSLQSSDFLKVGTQDENVKANINNIV